MAPLGSAALQVILVVASFIVLIIPFSQTQKNRPKGPPNLTAIPRTSFNCIGRLSGYYADPDAECQVYHMCGAFEEQYSYLCPGYTLFNQKYMVCDHWNQVNCSTATEFYNLNEKIGKVPKIKGFRSSQNDILKNKKKPRMMSPIFKVFMSVPHTGVPVIANSTQNPKFLSNPKTIKSTVTPSPVVSTTTTSTESPKTNFTFNLPSRFSFPNRKQFPFGVKRSGHKIKFGKNNDIKFRPLFKKPKNFFFDHNSFTIAPDILKPTPPTPRQDHDSEEDFFTFPENPFAPKDLPTFLIPPFIENSIKPQNKFLKPNLTPPLREPVTLHGENQERHTPLTVRFRPLLKLSSFSHSKPRHSSTHWDFFIPSIDDVSPVANDIPELTSSHKHHSQRVPERHIMHGMTMTFPNSMMMRRRRPYAINPECPRCHPAFLRQNECQPCVIIK